MAERSGSGTRRRRKVIGPRDLKRRPKVATEASAKSLQKILDGLSALKSIETPAQAKEALENGLPTSTSKFIAWKRLGSDSLYTTHSQYLVSVQAETARLRKLHREWQRRQQRLAGQGTDQKDMEIQQLRERERYHRDMLSLLAGEVLLAGKAWELERDQRLHVERLFEQETGRRLPRSEAVELDLARNGERADNRPIEEKIADIAAHREKRDRANRADKEARRRRRASNLPE